jgi:DNA-binding LacI/PurR family transcriptional regulator
MAVTQKDIARALGLSPSLVSRVLSDKARKVAISEQTIEKVKKLAQEIGYTPNTAAQSLKGISSRTVGVMVGHFNSSFFGQLVDIILKKASAMTYSVVLAGFNAENEPTDQELRFLLKHHLDGIIVIGSSKHTNWMRNIRNNIKIPIVHIGHGPSDEVSTRITIDEDQSMHLLLSHLRENNCSRAAFIGFGSLVSDVRYAGVKKHAKKLKIEIVKNGVIDAGGNPLDINTATDKLLALSPRPHAAICASDELALELINELSTRRISVPKDMAVVGVNDIPYAHLFRPRLTTISQPVDELIDLSFEAISKNQDPQEIALTPQLIVRESSLYGK